MQRQNATTDLRENPEALSSFAVLKVNWDENQEDYIENFVPFVADCLREARKESVSLSEIQDILSERIGFDVPQGAVKTILGRASKRGYVERSSGAYRPNFDALSNLKIEKSGREAERDIRALVRKLINFCEQELGVTKTEQEATAAIHDYLRQFAAPVLSLSIRGDDSLVDAEDLEEADYEVQRFVKHLDKEDSDGFAYLEEMAKGSMMASVLLYDDISEATRHFADLSVYLDTPFLVPLLGVNGDEGEHLRKELLQLLRLHQVDLCCFERTFDELRGVLDGIEKGLRIGGTREYNRESVAPYLSASDIRRISNNLDTLLQEHGIQVQGAPPLTDYLSINEEELDDKLQEVIGYKRRATREHDVEALAAIYRLRGGRAMTRLESAKAVFVTENSRLVRASDQYFGSKGISRYRAPLCILEHDMATRAWLKSPAQARNLPRQQMVSRSLAALQPSDALWEKYLDEIERLKERGEISEEEYVGMRFSQGAPEALSDATHNDDENFSEDTIGEVIARLNQKAQEEPKSQLREERATRQEREAELEKEQNRKTELEQKLSATQKKSRRERGQLTAIVGRHADRARKEVNGLFYAMSGLALAAVSYFAISNWDTVEPLAFILSLTIVVLSFIVGRSLKPQQYIGPLQRWLDRTKIRRTARLLEKTGLSSIQSKRKTIAHFKSESSLFHKGDSSG